MFDRMVRHIIRTGKAHRWLKPLASIAMVLLFGGAAQAKRAESQSDRIRKAGKRMMAALTKWMGNSLKRQAGRRSMPGKFRPSRRPAARAMAVALSVCMVFTATPQAAFAVEVGTKTGLCEHHPAHTVGCGYQEAKPGHPCEHEHRLECYTDELICGLIEDEDGTATGSDADHRHTQECYKLDCPHERGEHKINGGEGVREGGLGHNESCDYIEALEGKPCSYVCAECENPVKDDGNGTPLNGNNFSVPEELKPETVQPDETESITVLYFDELDGAVRNQTVKAGTTLEELVLPDTLSAMAQTGDENPEPVVIEGVTWEPDALYERAAGEFIFTASAAGYIPAQGVDWPVITVTVEEVIPALDEIDALCTAIDALPTVEEIYENAPGDADPEFASWVTESSVKMAEVPALWEQFLALSKDAAAMERITEARAEKLAALNNLAERLGEMEPKTGASTPTVSVKKIFANGVEIKIVSGETEGYTNILYDKNNDNTIEDTEYFKIGSADPTGNGYNLEGYTIYGGSASANVDGATKIIMTGGTVGSLYGGGWANSNDADVKGAEIILSGGVVRDGVYGGGEANAPGQTASVTGDTSVTLSGDVVIYSYVNGGGFAGGPNQTATVTGNAAVTMTGGKVGRSDVSGQGVYGGGCGSSGGVSTVGSSSVQMTGGKATAVYGGGWASRNSQGNVTGSSSVNLSAGAVVSNGVYGDGYTVSGGTATVNNKTVTVGGGVKTGGSTGKGIVISGSTGGVSNGVDSFAISDDLTQYASVNVNLPAGYDASSNPTIATEAVEADLAKIKLVGAGATGKEAYFENNAIKVRAESAAHTNHCVCGGSVSIGGHTSHSDVTWTAWTSNNSLPDTAGSYYLTQNVALTSAWTVPTGTVNLCLGGKTVTCSVTKKITSGLYACVDIPAGAALTVCDHKGSGSMSFTPRNTNGSIGICGRTNSAFTLYGGAVSATKSAASALYALYNNGGIFDVHGGTVSATHNSSGGSIRPFAYCVNTNAGTTTLWGGAFTAMVTNSTSYSDGNSGAHGAKVTDTSTETGNLRLAGAPTFTVSNNTNANNQAAIVVFDGRLYAHAENTPFSGDSVNIKLLNDYGIVVREVDDSNKGKFSISNVSTGFTINEITEGGKIHLALTRPYQVKFDANGGTGSMANQSFTGYIDSKALTQNAYTKDGSSFTGWNIAQNGTGTAYADKAEVSKLAYGGTVTLYAQWEELAQSSDATLSELTYKVGNGQAVSVPNFSASKETYDVELPFGASTNLSITLAGTVNDSNARITKNEGVTLSDGSGTATIEVTAEDGTTTKTYTVNFTTASDTRSDAKQIIAFTIPNQVGETDIKQDNHTITVTMPAGTNVTGLTPTITVSNEASVSPQSGVTQNFTGPVTYTVTAENGTTQDYNVSVIIQAPTVTGVTVSPTSSNVQRGSTRQFRAAVTGTNSPAQTVTWSLVGSYASGTGISDTGLLTVASDEVQATVTVKATSTVDTSKSGTAVVAVTNPIPLPTHTITASAGSGGTITPDGAVTVNEGESQTFTITPAPNYAISRVTVDGAGKDTAPAYTFENVTGDHSISVTFRYIGGSSSGGDSSSSGGSSSAPSTTTSTTAGENGTSITTTTTSKDSSGKTTTVTTEVTKDAAGNATGGATTVTTENITASSDQGSSTVTVKPDAAAINGAAKAAGASEANPMDISVSVPQDTVKNELQKAEVSTVRVEVVIPRSVEENPTVRTAGVTVEKETVDAARQTGKNVTVTVREDIGAVKAVWSLDGQAMGNAAGQSTDLNLGVHTAPVQSGDPIAAPLKPIVTAAGQENGLVISLTVDGTLLSAAKLTVPATNQTAITAGSTVALYRFDSNTRALSAISGGVYSVDANGNVTIDVPAGTRTGAKETYVLLPVPAAAQTASQPAADAGGGAVHTIKAGDTLNKISRQYGCRVEDLLALNPGVDIYNLQIGSNLRVP